MTALKVKQWVAAAVVLVIANWILTAAIGWMSDQFPSCYQIPQPTTCTYNH